MRPEPETRAIVALVPGVEIDRAVWRRIISLWEEPNAPAGTLGSLDQLMARFDVGDATIYLPPELQRPYRWGMHFSTSPYFKEEWTGSVHYEESGYSLTFLSSVLEARRFPYATFLTGGKGFDLREATSSDIIVDAAMRMMRLLTAPFVFGDVMERFEDLALFDPRSRVWGLTYYGPDMVREIGRERLASAPAFGVEFDEAGGAWVRLDALPFAPSKEKEERRVAVERHLRVRELWPDAPAPGKA